MKKKSPLRMFAVLSAVTLVAAGCGSSGGGSSSDGGSGGSIKLAGVYENVQDAFWGTFVCGAKSEAKKLGVDLKTYTTPTQDNTKLATTLDTAMLTNPQGVAFNPVDGTAWNSKVQGVMNKGIPVVTSSNAIPTQYTYAQAEPSGDKYASKVVDLVKGQSGKAVQLVGLATKGQDWEVARLGGLQKALKSQVPGITWLPDAIDNFDVNKGTQIISGLITANPDLKLILAVAGPEGQAAAAAIKQTKMTGKVKLVAFDAVPAEVDALKSGEAQILIAQPAFDIGAAQIKLVADAVKEQGTSKAAVKPDGKPQHLQLGMITKDTVDSAEAKSYIYNASC